MGGHSVSSELLDFNVLSSNHIQHQSCNTAAWTLPHITPLFPRTHYTRTCGHQLTSPPCHVRGPLQFSSRPPPLTWHSKGPSPGSLTPNTHTDIGINGVQSWCDDESFFSGTFGYSNITPPPPSYLSPHTVPSDQPSNKSIRVPDVFVAGLVGMV